MLQGDSFYITKDTVRYAGDVLTHVLEVWIEDLQMETGPMVSYYTPAKCIHLFQWGYGLDLHLRVRVKGSVWGILG